MAASGKMERAAMFVNTFVDADDEDGERYFETLEAARTYIKKVHKIKKEAMINMAIKVTA